MTPSDAVAILQRPCESVRLTRALIDGNLRSADRPSCRDLPRTNSSEIPEAYSLQPSRWDVKCPLVAAHQMSASVAVGCGFVVRRGTRLSTHPLAPPSGPEGLNGLSHAGGDKGAVGGIVGEQPGAVEMNAGAAALAVPVRQRPLDSTRHNPCWAITLGGALGFLAALPWQFQGGERWGSTQRDFYAVRGSSTKLPCA